MNANVSTTAPVITPEQLLNHWQGHRRLSRRVIEAFPDDQLFSFSIGGMRSYGELAKEMLRMAAPSMKGFATNEWSDDDVLNVASKEEVLRRWDEATEEIERLWSQMSADRFQEKVVAFGQWPGQVFDLLWYIIDNEIHHRAQGYVYLRALGIEPPAFYDRD